MLIILPLVFPCPFPPTNPDAARGYAPSSSCAPLALPPPLYPGNTNVKKVVQWYKQSVKEMMVAAVPQTLAEEARWARMLEGILDRHGPTLVTMAKALFEFKERFKISGHGHEVPDKIFPYLDRFYSSRIGIRTLIGEQGGGVTLLPFFLDILVCV